MNACFISAGGNRKVKTPGGRINKIILFQVHWKYTNFLSVQHMLHLIYILRFTFDI